MVEDAEANSTSYDYPDWHEFNLSDPRDKSEFIHEYEAAQQHDKTQMLVFYVIMCALLLCLNSFVLQFWKA